MNYLDYNALKTAKPAPSRMGPARAADTVTAPMIEEFDPLATTVRAACDANRLGMVVEEVTMPGTVPMIGAKWEKPCCENERRDMNGGCVNCGDPCL
jgi:hypothetical protein